MIHEPNLQRFARVCMDPDDPGGRLHYNEALDRFEGDRRGYVRGANWLFDFAPETATPSGYKGSYDDEGVVANYVLSAFADELLSYPDGVGIYAKTMQLIPCDLALGSDGTLVDAGCGLGRTTWDLAGRFPESLVIGFDLSSRMLGVAKKIMLGTEIGISDQDHGFGRYRLKPRGIRQNVFLARADVTRMPLKSGSVDVLVNVYLIDRLGKSIESFYAEAARVLRAGGCFIGLDPLAFMDAASWVVDPSSEGLSLGDMQRICTKNTEEVLRKHFDNVSMSEGPNFKTVRDAAGNYSSWQTRCFVGRKS